MKFSLMLSILALSCSLAHASEIKFLNLPEIQSVNGTIKFWNEANKIERRNALSTFMSYCGTYVGLESPYTLPTQEIVDYKIISRLDKTYSNLRMISIFAEDEKGFAQAAIHCFETDDLSLSQEEILQKHLGSLVEISID